MMDAVRRDRLRVVHLVEDLGLGGLERVVQSLARRADARRYSVEVLCATRGGPLRAALEAEQIRVTVAGAPGYYPSGVLQIARILQERQADVLHSHGHVAGVVGRLASFWCRVPVVVHHLHTLDTTLRPRHRRLERLLALSAFTSRIICCSGAVARHATRDLGLPERLITTIHNGIDPPPPGGREQALRTLGHPTPPLLGCVGSLQPHKGQRVLIEALGRLPAEIGPVTVVLVGEGPDRSCLEAQARRLGDRHRVLFVGATLEARALLPAFDLVVMPSVGREGLGLVALEAMDAARPVVASDLDGLPEAVVSGETGLLVPPGNAALLAGAIGDILSRPDRGAALGAAGRRRVEAEFRAETMAARVEAVYEEAFRERRAA
jgi:glycosyltransferase involved in cell wall biosynthesis